MSLPSRTRQWRFPSTHLFKTAVSLTPLLGLSLPTLTLSAMPFRTSAPFVGVPSPRVVAAFVETARRSRNQPSRCPICLPINSMAFSQPVKSLRPICTTRTPTMPPVRWPSLFCKTIVAVKARMTVATMLQQKRLPRLSALSALPVRHPIWRSMQTSH